MPPPQKITYKELLAKGEPMRMWEYSSVDGRLLLTITFDPVLWEHMTRGMFVVESHTDPAKPVTEGCYPDYGSAKAVARMVGGKKFKKEVKRWVEKFKKDEKEQKGS